MQDRFLVFLQQRITLEKLRREFRRTPVCRFILLRACPKVFAPKTGISEVREPHSRPISLYLEDYVPWDRIEYDQIGWKVPRGWGSAEWSGYDLGIRGISSGIPLSVVFCQLKFFVENSFAPILFFRNSIARLIFHIWKALRTSIEKFAPKQDEKIPAAGHFLTPRILPVPYQTPARG
jgi:hypothetical protein